LLSGIQELHHTIIEPARVQQRPGTCPPPRTLLNSPSSLPTTQHRSPLTCCQWLPGCVAHPTTPAHHPGPSLRTPRRARFSGGYAWRCVERCRSIQHSQFVAACCCAAQKCGDARVFSTKGVARIGTKRICCAISCGLQPQPPIANTSPRNPTPNATGPRTASLDILQTRTSGTRPGENHGCSIEEAAAAAVLQSAHAAAGQLTHTAAHGATAALTLPHPHTHTNPPPHTRAHEPRFGTEDNPIVVPSLLPERIIGVTDPEDDTLVIWGIVREGEPPKQVRPLRARQCGCGLQCVDARVRVFGVGYAGRRSLAAASVDLAPTTTISPPTPTPTPSALHHPQRAAGGGRRVLHPAEGGAHREGLRQAGHPRPQHQLSARSTHSVTSGRSGGTDVSAAAPLLGPRLG